VLLLDELRLVGGEVGRNKWVGLASRKGRLDQLFGVMGDQNNERKDLAYGWSPRGEVGFHPWSPQNGMVH
jgi:hypothetical protein